MSTRWVRSKKCDAPGCSEMVCTARYCDIHRQRMYRYGRLEKIRLRRLKCSVPGCTNKHDANGLCVTHRKRMKKHGAVYPGIPVVSGGESMKKLKDSDADRASIKRDPDNQLDWRSKALRW